MRPIAALLPDWLPAEGLLSLVLVLALCFLVGVAVLQSGRAVRERMEKVFFERLPGYGLLRSLTQRLAGDSDETAWQPALAEIEDALVPAFIIEELDDGRFTIFVPSVPTPLAGAVYVLAANACTSSKRLRWTFVSTRTSASINWKGVLDRFGLGARVGHGAPKGERLCSAPSVDEHF